MWCAHRWDPFSHSLEQPVGILLLTKLAGYLLGIEPEILPSWAIFLWAQPKVKPIFHYGNILDAM